MFQCYVFGGGSSYASVCAVDKEDWFMELDGDGCVLDMFVCGTCKNQFWTEAYAEDLYLNDPVCCPYCCVMFDDLAWMEEDEEG